MGRRRKNDSACVNNLVTSWDTAIYARLSKENSGKDDNGESIDGQVSICKEYINEHPFLNLVDTYIDNGWTGTNTDRPEFQRLLGDIKEGKIKALVIKDFSRFSRNYIEAGNLLENIFPTMGVRFISVADRYDSYETDGSAESLLIPLKNLINSFYSKDISKKVSTAVHTKQLAGEYIPGMIPYGYKKSETVAYRYDIDPETAPIVQRIFAEKLSGKKICAIVQGLNDDGIPSPGKLKCIRAQKTGGRYDRFIWKDSNVKIILRNPTYLGDLVFGRIVKALYLGHPEPRKEHDKSKWRIIHNAHPALIDRDSFEKVNADLDRTAKQYRAAMKRTKRFRESHLPVFSKVICGDCGGNMYHARYKRKDGQCTITYRCMRKRYNPCKTAPRVAEEVLKDIVRSVLIDHLSLFADVQAAIEKMKKTGYTTNRQQEMDTEINNIIAQLKKRQRNKEMLYEDYTDGILSAEDYIYHKQKYDEECNELSERLSSLEMSREKMRKTLSMDNKWIKNISTITKTKKITREIADAFIESIAVYGGNDVRAEVKLKYTDELETLMKAIEEMEGER